MGKRKKSLKELLLLEQILGIEIINLGPIASIGYSTAFRPWLWEVKSL